MTTTTTRQLTIDEADAKRALAMQADKAGDTTLRDAFLIQAADRYQAVGLIDLALWCQRRAGHFPV